MLSGLGSNRDMNACDSDQGTVIACQTGSEDAGNLGRRTIPARMDEFMVCVETLFSKGWPMARKRRTESIVQEGWTEGVERLTRLTRAADYGVRDGEKPDARLQPQARMVGVPGSWEDQRDQPRTRKADGPVE